jgi:hypothetical protein
MAGTWLAQWSPQRSNPADKTAPRRVWDLAGHRTLAGAP